MTKPISREKSFAVACTVSGTTYTLYQCPTNCVARVPLVVLTNNSLAAVASLKLYKADVTTSYFVLGSKSLALGEFVQLSDQTGLILQPGDKLEVIAVGTTPNVGAVCTAMEQFKPVG